MRSSYKALCFLAGVVFGAWLLLAIVTGNGP